MTDAGIIDYRPLKAAELAAVLVELRKEKGWTQETLAELARVSSRTIQRIEEGQSSSVDTRRSIARAFEYHDLDIFSRPWPLPNIEKLKEESARIERETVKVKVAHLAKGGQLRELAEQGHGCIFMPAEDDDDEAQVLLSRIKDYFVEYGDCHSLHSATDKLDVNRQFQAWIDQLAFKDIGLVGGLRRVRLQFNDQPSGSGVLMDGVYIVSSPIEALPTMIRVPRNTSLGL